MRSLTKIAALTFAGLALTATPTLAGECHFHWVIGQGFVLDCSSGGPGGPGGPGPGNPPPPPPPPQPPGQNLPYGPDTCKQGFVWRDAIPGDHVCVSGPSRSQAAHENAIAGSRVNPNGAYGPNSCKQGFVWREAYAGDVVCVTAQRRDQVHQENIAGPSHRVLQP